MNLNENSLIIEPKQIVIYQGQKYKISHLIDVDKILAKNSETGKAETLPIKDLKPFSALDEENNSKIAELSLISEKDWAEARRRYEIIFPLIKSNNRRTEKEVKIRASQFGVHTVTLYRWIRMFEETGEVSSLLPGKSGSPRGKSKLLPEVDEIVKITIEKDYLHKQRRSIKSIYKKVKDLCRAAKLAYPTEKTIRRKITQVTERDRIARRFSEKRARENFDLLRGEFPHADFPLAVIQIDHTELDIIIVDETYRQPIGRPWITLAIEVFSRVVFGFSISLDAPSNLSVGLCLTHGILPKELWLEKIGVEGSWASWGFPKTIHADNAGEFRGNMLRRACEKYGITLEWRPIGKPHYGAHIERLMGTFGTEIHELPGTTFSNAQDRKDYDSEKEAVFTLRELEKWLTTFIVGEYHERFHEGINTTPMAKWREGILGNDEMPGTGLPPRILDGDTVRFDFLPAISRTIQQYGVRLNEIHYNHDILKRYVNAKDEKNPKLKRSFVFKRDPRDISELYFYDPEIKQYFSIPYRDTSRPAINLWELREIRNELKKMGRGKVNETMIFETREKLRQQEENATKITKTLRRKKERRLLYQTSKEPNRTNKELSDTSEYHKNLFTESSPKLLKIQPFEDIEDI